MSVPEQNRGDLNAGWGVHNRVTDDAEFACWFYEDSAIDAITIAPERIPDAWREIV